MKNNDKTQQTNALLSQDTSDGGVATDQDDYAQLQAQTNSSCANINVVAAPTSALLKHFNRSKSNIENFTSQPKIISTTNASLAATTITAAGGAAGRSKTLTSGQTNGRTDDRGQADGGSNQQDSDFDEFSSQDEDEGDAEPQSVQNFYQNTQEVQSSSMSSQGANSNLTSVSSKDGGQCQVLGRCKALYSYSPKLYDELELTPGDIIEIHAKQDDGWWLGALRNQIGIFPATYVEDCT